MRDKSGTVAIVIACVVLAASLAGLGKVYWNKHATETAPAVVENGGTPAPAASPTADTGAANLAGTPAATGMSGARSTTGPSNGARRRGFRGSPPADGAPAGAGTVPESAGGGFRGRPPGQTPGDGAASQPMRQFTGFGPRNGSGAGGYSRDGQRWARPSGSSGGQRPSTPRPTITGNVTPTSASAGGGQAPSGGGRLPSRGGRPSASGGGQPLGPDPQIIAQWDRDIQRARETIQNAKLAVRESNQDQLQELLDEALAALPNISSEAATAHSQRGRMGPSPGGPGQAPGWSGRSDMTDTLALGQRVQQLLYSTLDMVRGLTPEQYEAERSQIVIGILTQLLTSGQTSYGGRGGEGSPRFGPGGGFPAGSGAPSGRGRDWRTGRGRPAGPEPAPAPAGEQ